MIILNIVSSLFKVHTTRKGIHEPAVVFTTETGTLIQFTDYSGGKSIFIQRPTDNKSQEIVHWGIDNTGKAQGYGEPRYTLDFFRPFAQQGEDIKDIAVNFTEQVLGAAADAFNSEEGREFLASLVEMRINEPAQPAPRSAFARILGTMSQFRSCSKGVTTADEFLDNIAKSDAKRAEMADGGTNLPVASLHW